MIRPFIFICIPLLLIHCRSREIPPGTMAEPLQSGMEISLTEQGGFSGSTLVYRLSPAGHITRSESPGTVPDTLGHVTPEEMAAVFSKLEDLKFFETEYQRPGNLTYTIEARKGGTVHAASWAAGDDSAPGSLPEIRRLIMDIIKK